VQAVVNPYTRYFDRLVRQLVNTASSYSLRLRMDLLLKTDGIDQQERNGRMLSSAARLVEFNQPEKRVLAKEVAHGWFRFTRCKRSTRFSVSAQAPILFILYIYIYIDNR
jgi:hypothetical protein